MMNSLLNTATSRISYLDQTQQVLARNIANLDTPGFTPQTTIPFAKMLNGKRNLPLTITHNDDQT